MRSAAGLVRLLEPDDGGALAFGPLTFVEPAHLVGAAALAEAAHRDRRPFALRPPEAAGAARFACRMRLGPVLVGLGFDDPLGTVRERPLANELLEVTALGGGAAAAALAELVSQKVRRAHGASVADALFQSTAEIGQNAEDYAGITGYVAAVTVPANRELLVAVADAGVGMAATLGGGQPLADADALALALEGVSSRPGPGHGSGVRLTMESVRALQGQAVLVSGEAAVTVRGGRTSAPRKIPVPYPGTLFQARIPLG